MLKLKTLVISAALNYLISINFSALIQIADDHVPGIGDCSFHIPVFRDCMIYGAMLQFFAPKCKHSKWSTCADRDHTNSDFKKLEMSVALLSFGHFINRAANCCQQLLGI